MLTVVEQHPRPVIDRRHPGSQGNKHGFEGGSVVVVDGVYHLFTSEMIDDPLWVKMRLGHWSSTDRVNWRREGTLFESSGEFAGMDDRAALWSPMPIFDEVEEVWNLFYVAYRCMPETKGSFCQNFEGKIFRAVSTLPGRQGIAGPYRDVGIILRPMPNQDAWEGLQGTDSFYPFQVGAAWYAFYGSAQTQFTPIPFWGVGLARAASLAGPWRRCSERNPVLMDPKFVENPIVTRFEDGTYGCVSDATFTGRGFKYAQSKEGLNWGVMSLVELREDGWLKASRTPLGLLPRADGLFDMLFTGGSHEGYACVGLVTLRRTSGR